jgi:hypothetical protein
VTVGFCTPIPFQAGGTPAASTIPADANALNGYYVTRVLAADQAGNVSAAFNSTVLGDNSVPTVVNVDFPPTVTGNATTVFPANVTDNAASGVGDFVGSWASLVYAAGTLQYAVTGGPGAAFDGVLTNTATINPAVPNFIKNLQVSTGGAPTATTANVTNATDVIVSGQDAANNVGFKDIVITSQPTNFVGAATTWPNFTGGFAITASAATVSNGPASVTAANPTTTVITGTANGTTGIFTNPFSTTQLWYRPTGSTVWFLATATEAVPAGASTSDNGAIRTWNFAFTWNPPAATPASHLGPPQTLTPAAASTINVDVMIIGINANGDAIATPVQVITLSNP